MTKISAATVRIFFGGLLVFLFSATSASAAISYERTPAGASITSPISFDITADTYADLGFGGVSPNFWGVIVFTQPDDGTGYLTNCIASTTLSNVFSLSIPVGVSGESVWIGGADTLENCIAQNVYDGIAPPASTGEILEDDISGLIFTVVAGLASMFQVPTSTPTDVLANVSSTLSDAGFLAVVAIAAAIPLLFYVVKQLIGLIPKSRGRTQ